MMKSFDELRKQIREYVMPFAGNHGYSVDSPLKLTTGRLQKVSKQKTSAKTIKTGKPKYYSQGGIT